MDFLIPQEKYLEAGVHIGTKTKQGSMKEFIYKSREDGLNVLDLKKTDWRIKAAANLIANYSAEKVFVVGSKDSAVKAVQKFCEVTHCTPLTGRFTPGRFTNPSRNDFCEPKLVLVIDPGVDRQAVREASEITVPVIALCDTNNTFKCVDLVIPTNNKGRKAIALILWILAREVLKKRGEITSNEEFTVTQTEFDA